jgi:3-oxoacyl-[acyl-carrier-protein] synthase II
MSTPHPGIVITGLGTVDAFGAGRESTAAALERGEPVLSEVDRSAGYHRRERSRMAALVGSVDLRAWLPVRQARRMSPPSRFAVAAARMAVADATGGGGGDEAATPAFGAGTAVAMATAYGAASVTERILRQLVLESPEAISPALFTESVANAPAAQVALALGARAANITVTQREASPLIALGAAAGQVRRGAAWAALAGSVEELNPLIHSILDRFGALARPGPDGHERARPFDLGRTGFLAGEGATVVTLEAEDRARRRGAPMLARLALATSAFDPTAGAAGWGRGAGRLAASLGQALEQARIGLETIGRIVSRHRPGRPARGRGAARGLGRPAATPGAGPQGDHRRARRWAAGRGRARGTRDTVRPDTGLRAGRPRARHRAP